MNTFAAPPDDPLLDASGNVVMDSSGHPVSDPNEQFHQVKPFQFDPAHTWLVQAAWLNGTGCPTTVAYPVYPATSPNAVYTEPGCPTGDPKDQHIEGLLLVKTGPTANNAAAIAELKKVRGLTGSTLFELGYDIRKAGGSASDMGSHCGGGAPRFDIVTQDGVVHFVGCNSGVPRPAGEGWVRLRWNPIVALPPIMPGDVITRIFIVFDEGQDTGGPDFFGAAFLDNVDVNGQLVGAGPTDAR